MVGVAAERLGDDFIELGLDLFGGLSGSKSDTVADPEDMRVDRKGLLTKGGIEHDISRLAAHSRQFLELLTRPWNFTAIFVDQCLAEQDDVPGLGVEQSDRLDRVAQLVFAEFNHLLRRPNPRK